MKIPLAFLFSTLTLAAQFPAGHWNFDGETVEKRLQESYRTSTLDASERDGSSTWQDREGFGQVLANGTNLPYLAIPNRPEIAPGSGDFSLSLWIRRTSGNGATAGILDALDGIGTGFQLFFLNNLIRVRLDDDQGNVVLVDSTSPQFFLNRWIHLVLSVDRQNEVARLYVDATEITPPGGVGLANLTGSLTPNQDWWVGRLNTDNPAHGQIDDLAIFPRLLTSTERTRLASGSPVLTLFPPTPPLPGVVIAPASGVLTAGTPITLTGNGLDEIRYTLDGTDPDASSPRYTQPLVITEPTEVRARGFLDGNPGPLSLRSFVVVPATPPHVLLIVADDLGFNDLGCYGAVSVRTPHLDALASEGLRFTQFTTTGPGDLAARHALLTGRLAARANLPDRLSPSDPGLDPREWTLAESLRKRNYETALIGSWHLGPLPESHPRRQGFSLFHGLPYSLDQNPPLVENDTTLEASPDPATLLAPFTTRAEQFLTAQSAGQPFFLCLDVPSLPAAGDSYLGSYGNRVEALDAAVGRLLDTLEAENLSDNTLVVFLSDSGADRRRGVFPGGSNGQLRDGAGTTWEGGVRTPLIIRWPAAIPGGRDSRALLSLADLAPTLMELCGSHAPDDRTIDGQSEPAILLGSTTTPRPDKSVFTYRDTQASWELATARSGPWKLHRVRLNSDPENTVTASPPLLYQVEEDPSERIRRENDEASRLAQINSLVEAKVESVATDQLPPALSPLLNQPTLSPGDHSSLLLTFQRPATSLNDFYLIEVSNDLQQWDPFPLADFVDDTSFLDGQVEEVTLRLSGDFLSPPPRFLRLKYQPAP